ncbi:MAG: alkaline shock response membrane anchor protein AmaP, partial [Tepidiformaceae bacterium]
RALLVIYSLLLIAAAGGLIALAWNQDQKLDLNVGDFNLQGFVTSTNSAKWAVTVVLAAIAVVGLITLIVAVARSSSGSSKGTLRMKQADGGTVEVTTSAIENLLRDELTRLPSVRSVNPRVRLGSGGAVDTDIDASIEPSASIANATTLLSQGVANVLRDQVGVTNVRRPSIRISYDDMNARPIRGNQANAPRQPYNAPAGAPVSQAQFDPPIPHSQELPPRPPEPLGQQDAPRAPEPLGSGDAWQRADTDAPRPTEALHDEDPRAND